MFPGKVAWKKIEGYKAAQLMLDCMGAEGEYLLWSKERNACLMSVTIVGYDRWYCFIAHLPYKSQLPFPVTVPPKRCFCGVSSRREAAQHTSTHAQAARTDGGRE